MNTYRKNAISVGVLFIIGTAAGVISLGLFTGRFSTPRIISPMLPPMKQEYYWERSLSWSWVWPSSA